MSVFVCAPVHRLRLLYIMFNIQMLSRKIHFRTIAMCNNYSFFVAIAVLSFHLVVGVCVCEFFSLSAFGILPEGKMNNKKSKNSIRSRKMKENIVHAFIHTYNFLLNVYLVNKFCIKRKICVLWERDGEEKKSTKTTTKPPWRWAMKKREWNRSSLVFFSCVST